MTNGRRSIRRAFTEPHQLTVEDTYSIAAENTWRATDTLSVVAGLSYDWRHLFKAQDFIDPATATATGTFVNYPLNNGSALNGQAALIYTPAADQTYYFNVSDRTRFPTIFERFSTRFNSAASNPGLKAERAANFELGTHQAIGGVGFDGAVFYSDVTNAIESVILPPPAPTGTTQSQNVGHGTYYGVEGSVTTRLRDDLQLGANYTYQFRHITTTGNVAPFRLTGDPEHKGFVYLNWAASDASELHAEPLAGVQSLDRHHQRRQPITRPAPSCWRTCRWIIASWTGSTSMPASTISSTTITSLPRRFPGAGADLLYGTALPPVKSSKAVCRRRCGAGPDRDW